MMTKILSTSTVVLLGCTATHAFAPNHGRPQHATSSTQQGAVEEVASAIQQSSDILQHASVVGPFAGILEGHHPAQFDQEGIMMTEHLEPHPLKPGSGFVPPSPMKEVAAASGVVVPMVAAAEEKKRGKPVPVCYMD